MASPPHPSSPSSQPVDEEAELLALDGLTDEEEEEAGLGLSLEEAVVGGLVLAGADLGFCCC